MYVASRKLKLQHGAMSQCSYGCLQGSLAGEDGAGKCQMNAEHFHSGCLSRQSEKYL